jgi:protein involved in polysaccharide export with SLBB domain
MKGHATSALLALNAVLLSGCVSMSVPENPTETLSSPEKMPKASRLAPPSFASQACPPAGTTNFIMPAAKQGRKRVQVPPMRYSPGDRLNVSVFGSPEFTSDYVIGADGTLALAFVGAIRAGGLTNSQLTARVERAYISAELFTREGIKLSVSPVLYAPINVTVAGAVFNPGRHAIGEVKDSDKHDRMLTRFGDSPIARFIAPALRAAGGIRPDADLADVKLVRDGKAIKLDWRGAIVGSPVDDMPLIDGDHIQVSEAGCFQSGLVRPSQITPQQVRIIYSNLSTPAGSNAASIQSYQMSGAVPYGTRLLQGLVNANCVGGTYTTNARRHAVLISRNPRTLETEVIQRSVEELVRSADRDAINPYLMPDDAIACYDSTLTEVRDVMTLLQTIVLPPSTIATGFKPR